MADLDFLAQDEMTLWSSEYFKGSQSKLIGLNPNVLVFLPKGGSMSGKCTSEVCFLKREWYVRGIMKMYSAYVVQASLLTYGKGKGTSAD